MQLDTNLCSIISSIIVSHKICLLSEFENRILQIDNRYFRDCLEYEKRMFRIRINNFVYRLNVVFKLRTRISFFRILKISKTAIINLKDSIFKLQ